MKKIGNDQNDTSNAAATLIGQEHGTVLKKWRGELSIGLVFPNSYYVGMSNLGLQTIYSQINQQEHFLCERFFISGTGSDKPLSLESRKPPGVFNIIAFSISFENDFLNVINFLDSAGLKIRSDERNQLDPLIVAGGAAVTINPEALADYLDLVFLGEGEHILTTFLERIEDSLTGRWHKRTVLEAVADIPGLYVPAAYSFTYHPDGRIKKRTAQAGFQDRIVPARVKDLDLCPTHSTILTSRTEFANHYLIEMARGCSRRCKFCYGGWGYQPLRLRSQNSIVKQIEEGMVFFQSLKQKPLFGLIAPSMTDLPFLDKLLDLILEKGGQFSLSSIPLEFLNEKTITKLSRAPVHSLTLAPEAGTERLRNIIGKKWDEEYFFSVLETLWAANIYKLRFYFMVGLPGEQTSDLREIVQFIRRINHFMRKTVNVTCRMSLHLSLNAFVPKPHTPFQWSAMENQKNLAAKMKYISRELQREPHVTVTHDVPKWARVQGLIARADRRIGPFLVALDKHRSSIQQALNRININPAFYLDRRRADDELLPWDHLTGPREKDILLARNRDMSLDYTQTLTSRNQALQS